MKPRIYLSGPIYGTTDKDQEWRKVAAKKLEKWYEILDPLKRDYRKTKFNVVNSRDVVLGDLKELDHSNVIIANCERPGWGTAMEIFYGHMKGKPVLFFTSNPNPSPWLLSHARNVRTLDNAIKELKKFRKTLLECGI